jgi:hypothetical protein
MSINKETGLWRDFKSGETGNFVHLVAIVENIGYKEAEFYLLKKLSKDHFILIDVLREKNKTKYELSQTTNSLNHYKNDFLPIREEMKMWGNPIYIKAVEELEKRKINYTNKTFYVAYQGRFVNRLILPYEKNGNLHFFQGRALTEYAKPKYLNPSSKDGIKASDVLYPFNTQKSYVILTEGVFDAISLQEQGLNATCVNGALISLSQASQIKTKKVILAFDGDDAGRVGVLKSKKVLDNLGIKSFYVSPPPTFKDWNEAHQKDFDLRAYFKSETKSFLSWYIRNAIVS